MAASTTGTAPSAITNGDPGIQGAASAFEQLLTLQEGDTQDEPEASATESDEDTDTQAADEETDEGTEDAEQPEGDEQAQKTAEEKLFTVRVDGKDEQVPLSELLAGYSRNKDYTQKTQALSHERKQFAQQQEQVRAQQAEYATLLPKLRAALEADLKEPNWEELRAADPANAAIEWQRFQERKSRISGLKAEEARVTEEQARQLAAERNRVLIEEQQALLKRPELAHWRDEAKADADAKRIVDTLKDAGFGDDELQIFDHRAMVVAWKASQYDQLISQRNAAKQSVQQKATKAPVARPGNGGQQSQSALTKASSRLAKSGSVRDAAAVFEHLIN